MFVVDSQDGAIVAVRAQPRSSRALVEGVVGDALKIRIRSAPVDGKANKELVETLAGALGVAKSRVFFKSGETSKTKRLVVSGMTAAQIAEIFRVSC